MLTPRVTSIRAGSLIASVVCLGLSACTTTATTQSTGRFGAQDGEWRTYSGDLAGTRYSALDQIDAENFDTLKVAWRFTTEHLGSRPEGRLSATPADGQRRAVHDGGNGALGRRAECRDR